MKKGISLVVLIITIIVLIILTGTVIITMNQGDIIGKSKEAVFKSDVATFQEDLRNKLLNKQIESEGAFNRSGINATYDGENEADIKYWINSYADKYGNKFAIDKGELVYVSENISDEERNWANDLGLNDKQIIAVQEDFTYDYSGTVATVTGLSSQGESKIASEISILRIPDIVTYNNQNYIVTSIGDQAFDFCYNLKLKSLPSGLTSIGSMAFLACNNLELAELPSGLTSIGAQAFDCCSKLSFTELPMGITSIEYGTFKGSDIALTSLPKNLISIGDYAFTATNLKLTELPNSLTSIGEEAFSYTLITSLEIPWSSADPRNTNSSWGLDANIIHYAE